MTSLWQATAPSIGFDESSPRRPDVVVVGAGLTGLATAALLAEQGAHVVVLEAREPGAVATGGTTAKLSLLQSDRLHRIRRFAGRAATQAFVDGSLAGQAWLRGLLERLGAPAEPRSAVSFASGDEGVASLERELETARELGLPVREGGAERLPFPTAAALELPDQAQLHPLATLAALAAHLRAHGGAIMHASVRRVRRADSGLEIETDAGAWRADSVVLATGSPVPARGTSALLEAHRSYAAAFRVRGLTAEAAAALPMALGVDAPTRSLRTAEDADGTPLLIAGGVGHLVGRHRDPRQLVAELDRWVLRHWPDAARTHAWSAQDYRTPDRLPWIGARPGSRGRVLLATGFDKWGMTGGAMSALAIAGRLGGAEPDWARALRRRGTTLASVGRLAGTTAATVAADVGAWRDAMTPAVVPPEGQGSLGRDGLRLVATSTVDGRTQQMSAFCPHIGALVRWNPEARTWDCSAHGSRFAPDGTRLEGPAACPLRALPRRAQVEERAGGADPVS
jgi:glycine/D-amino acid oxidase-like deaminating enzyme